LFVARASSRTSHEQPAAVSAQVAQPSSVELVATGYVVANRSSKLGADVVGRISRTAIGEGDVVAGGTLLFEIDETTERADLASADARTAAARARAKVAASTLAETEQTHAREQWLADQGAVAPAGVADLGAHEKTLRAALHAAEADANAAAADALSLRARVDRHRVVAPFDAIVATRPAQPGDVVSPGMPLVELYDPHSLVVEIDVPEARFSTVREGAPCSIALDALEGKSFEGHAARTRPRVDRAKATVTVEVRFVSPPVELRPDMAARVSFSSPGESRP